jgi:hypothetical protein
MVAQTDANNIRLYFGSNLDGNAADETYGISNVQIWVR